MKNNLLDKILVPISNCIAVKGAERSVICDLQLGTVAFIPNDLQQMLSCFSGKSFKELYAFYAHEHHESIDEYLTFLLDSEYILAVTSKEANFFPSLPVEWDYSGAISNAIIEISRETWCCARKIMEEIEQLHCQYCVVKLKDHDITVLQDLLAFFKNRVIQNVEILVPYTSASEAVDFETLFNGHMFISSITFYNSPFKKTVSVMSNTFFIEFIEENVFSALFCGAVHPKYFAPNIPHFTESQSHNTCLNRKIAIDAEGNIKNCPSMAKSYGNIRNTTLREAIEQPGFKDLWNLHKDQVQVCKDCEFRHICTDCRAYLENPDDLYSKPLKCGYNPYTCEWEEWSTHPLKQKAIEHYGMQELIRKT